jgi:hypothetical protein
VKALLKPSGAPPKDTDDSGNDEEDNEGGPEMMPDLEDVEDDIEDEDEDWDEADDEGLGVKDGDEEEDPFDELDEEERKKLLENTLAVRSTLNKVLTCFFTNFSSFYSHLFSKDPKTFFCNHPLDN